MEQLLAYQSYQFLKDSSHITALDNWRDVYRILGDKNIGLNDRTGKFKFPVNTAITDRFTLPFDDYKNINYRECGIKRVQEILNRQEKNDKAIHLMYSGGIDSSTILGFFIDLLGIKEASKRLTIKMNPQGIDENPEMWYKIIRPNFNIINSDLSYNNTDVSGPIYVLGELNDQLFGADVQQKYELWGGPGSLNDNISFELLKKFLIEGCGINEKGSNLWATLFLKNLDTCPRSSGTMWDVFWWYNFTWKWIYVYYRIFLFSRTEGNFDSEWIDHDYFPFYASEDFQKWSMYSTEKKHEGTWASYKITAKEYICKILGSTDYMNKVKRQSLKNVVYLRNRVNAFTIDKRVLRELHFNDVYNSDNVIENFEKYAS